MGGIVGYFRWRDAGGFDLSRAVVRARDQLAHRGPDAAGLYASADGRCVLGSRRLSIRDRSAAGNQPMPNEDETVWVVFNGEIYNADPLREALTRAGHRFRSRCDTEVLVHLYEERGADLVEDIDGVFGFAIYDSKQSSLLVARDRIGVKPLYYAHSATRFAFASEPKALLALPDVSRAPRLAELPSYLAFGCVPGPPTLHRDIEKLEPATRIRVSSSGDWCAERFWQFPASTRDPAERAELEAALGVALQQAVSKRNLADVPVGATLSGGIDSGLVVEEMSRSLGVPVPTFVIGYPGDDADPNSDLSYARILARHLPTDHSELILDRTDFAEVFDDLEALADDPNGSPSMVALSHLAKNARARGVRVLQVGDGADVVCFGSAVALLLWRARGRLSRIGRLMSSDRLGVLLRAFGDPLERLLERVQPLGVVVGNAIEPLRRYERGEHAYWGHGIVFSSQFRERLLGDRADWIDPHDRLVARLAREEGLRDRPYFDQLALVDLLAQLPERFLMRAERATMRHGVEARAPFLDPEVLKVAFRIPAPMRAASRKEFLRHYARDRLPAPLLRRSKSGFPTARSVFLAPEFIAQIRKRLLAPAFLECTGLHRGPLTDLVVAAERGRPYSLGPLWPLYMLALWSHHWT